MMVNDLLNFVRVWDYSANCVFRFLGCKRFSFKIFDVITSVGNSTSTWI